MRQVQGHIVLIQEERFRLTSTAGQGYLFTLAHNARIGVAELRAFQRAQRPVTVEYTGEPNLASGFAHDVRLADVSPHGPSPEQVHQP